MATELRYSIEARTDIGRKRTVNEDRVAIIDPDARGLQAGAVFVVADGMGGMKAGDVASQETVRVVQEILEERLAGDGADIPAALGEAIRRANDTVRALAAGGDDAAAEVETSRPGRSRSEAPEAAPVVMGTTCVVGAVRGSSLYLAHVGDSRAYLLRDGRLERLTRDHSLVEERVLAGEMTEDEARRSRFRNMITRAVGIEDDVEPELREEPLHEGDTVLVCTDGLTTMLDDPEIESILVRADNRSGLDLERAIEGLIDTANRKGGSDNITVLLLHARPSEDAASVAIAHQPHRDTAPTVMDFDALARDSERGGGKRSVLLSVLALIGALALIAAAALGFSPEARRAARGLLDGTSPATGRTTPMDYGPLAYDAPEPFAKYLARGDLLAFSPSGNLYFVGFASGRVAGLDRNGAVVGGVATLPIAPPPKNPVPVTTNYLATDPQGNVYIALTARKTIEKRDPKGRVLKAFKGFQRPEAVAVDDRGNIYVIDYNQIKILRAHPPSSGKGATSNAGK